MGLKEASGDISQIAKIAQLCGDKISIYSGNDDQIVPIMSLGGKRCTCSIKYNAEGNC